MSASDGALLATVSALAAQARSGEGVEAFALRSTETDVRVLRGEVESLAVAGDGGVGVRVVVAGRQGYAWAGSLDDDVVATLLAEARDNASFSAADPWLELPADGGTVVGGLDLYRESMVAVPTDDKVALALELERAASGLDPRVRGVESAAYGDGIIEAAIANSHGVVAAYRRTLCTCSVEVLAGSDDATQTGYGFSAGRAFEELDVERTARDATTRAIRLLGARAPHTQRLAVVLDPLVTRSLIAIVGSALNGESMLKGRSVFADRLGEVVAAPGVTLVDDPTDPAAFGAVGHDGEGVATRRNPLIVDGMLRAALHNTYTGRRSGAGSTGSALRAGYRSVPGVGARALSLDPGTRDLDAIVAGFDTALYVQSVSGLHSGVNPISGDFSVGVEGLMVRKGSFAEPVREATIASTLPRMLFDIAEVGGDRVWFPGAAAGMTLVIGEMTVSGT